MLAAAVLGYLVGSFPSADVASRLVTRGSVDLRAAGSGNPGGVNAARVLGRGWGVAVVAADITKGAAAGMAGRRVAGDSGACAAATTAIAGHILPPWSRFRGGKGVATSAGACLAVFPAFAPVGAAVLGLTALGSRRAERAIQLACATWVGASLAWWAARLPNLWGPSSGPGLVGFSVGGAGLVLAKSTASRRSSPASTILGA